MAERRTCCKLERKVGPCGGGMLKGDWSRKIVREPEMTCRLASPKALSQPLILGATYGASVVLFIVMVRLPYSRLHCLPYRRFVGLPNRMPVVFCLPDTNGC
jgi:hypothetical protein